MLKNYLLMVAAAMLMAACNSSADKHKIPAEIVTSENTEADMGQIYEADGLAKTVLVVRNETGDTLLPVACYTHCRCAEASAESVPVAPGEDLRIAFTYNPAYRNGIFMEELQIRFLNSRRIMSLVIKGEVIPCEHPVSEDHPYNYGEGLHLSHETLHFGHMKAGERGMIYIRMANDTQKEMEVGFGNPQPDALSFRHSKSLAAKGCDTMQFRFTMPDGLQPADTLRLSVPVSVNGREADKTLGIKAIY